MLQKQIPHNRPPTFGTPPRIPAILTVFICDAEFGVLGDILRDENLLAHLSDQAPLDRLAHEATSFGVLQITNK